MMPQTITKVLTKIGQVERELQQLKIAVYFGTPKRQAPRSRYAERALLREAKKTRQEIWRSKYAKKIARLS